MTVPRERDKEEKSKLMEYARSLHEMAMFGGSPDLDTLFRNAVDTEAYMRAFQDSTRVKMTLAAAEAAEAVGKKAAKGDLKAAQMVFDIVGLGAKGKGNTVNVLNQISVPPGEKAQLLADLRGDVIDAEEVKKPTK